MKGVSAPYSLFFTILSLLQDAISSAKREAAASFGDDRILMERFIERPRHIEVVLEIVLSNMSVGTRASWKPGLAPYLVSTL